jgi:hypothetical protein
MKKFFGKAFFVVFVVSMLVAPGSAQTFRGTVSGTVTDLTGAVISDASVELENPATSTTLLAKSDKTGEFNFPERVSCQENNATCLPNANFLKWPILC